NKKFSELKEELSKDNMLSEETQKAYEELQKLMEEIDDPEYLKAMEKLKEQLSQMNPEQMSEAIENLEFNEKLYKERLERTIELFKELKLNSDLDKLAKSFEDMARKEQERQETDGEPQTSKEQQALEQTLKENEQLKSQVDSLSQNTSDKNKQTVSEYQEQTKQELEKISEQLEKEIGEKNSGDNSGEKQEGQQGQKQDQNQQQQRQQQYQQMAEKTRSMMQSMGQQQQQINIAGLQYILYSLLNLSLEQEDLTTLASATENRSQAYVSYARNQRNVEGIFKAVSDSLYQLSAQIPQFSNQINEKKLEVEKRLQRSLEQMSERNRSQSSVASRQALGGINDIAFMIASLLEQLQNSQNSSGGGAGSMSMQQMMEQL
ncbi:MAG TPA: hypothetical protein DEG32_09550, partial [Balneolaceae bacterium]|nr:hypothetical protein [Balneolaceae bacterium]